LRDHAIPNHVVGFVVQHVSSVIQLEVLLLLHAHRARSYAPAELGRELRVNADWVEAQVQTLVNNGVLVSVGESPRRYQYQPRTSQLAEAVDDLARVYQERRVSLITLIFNKPVDQAQSFADAFRIRKEGSRG
jgi:hypothetical protein